MKKLLSTQAAADLLGYSRHTLDQWRFLKKGPPYHVTPTGSVRYDSDDLLNWVKSGAKNAE